MQIIKQSWFKNLGKLLTDMSRKWATNDTFLLNQRQYQKHLTWTVAQWSKVLFFNEHFAFHLEIKVCYLKSNVEFSLIWDAMSSIDVHPLFYQVQSQCCHLPGKLWAFHVSILRSFIEMLLWYLPLLLWYYCVWFSNQLSWL